ncbi:SET domain-containing protein [Terfezia boudieri ATCC MYA-4762]|uniref:SET domain-containing protein n=1 Tax=Terfezia boudieri ATCC MYA-4762 TaxID=1051890 RepID=A0A3N4LX33_9PEZI|nr:SET domain-containing protein [Terfezia boudieri ATCC MYA-4762]
MKVHKIGTSRPRKKASPSPASSSTHPGVEGGGTATKKRSGISLVERIWHGIYEGTKLAKQFHGDIGLDAFQNINRHCSTLYSSSSSFRILDLIMQAVWVDLFHARVATLASEPQNQYNSPTDNNILALKESRTVFECSEKEMRNKLAIWSGYKKIKDTGGWPALIFAEEGGGVYNVCKYRAGGWKEGIFDELEQLREAIELAADALQPEWRRLIEVLFGPDNRIPRRRSWEGQYPHQWVIGLDGRPIPLSDTYRGGLEYVLIETSVVDEEAWGDRDPRRVVPEGDEPYLCNTCGEIQSEEPLGNKCLCYPDLYGGGAGRRGGKYTPVQICRTQNKGNGLIARLPIPAGAGVGEFVGTITRGLRGVDVMEGGIEPDKYQISQARRGNFTRFINHSCKPNTHFKVFVWLGIERIIIVSNGVKAGTEITVDYSNGYWDGLDKICRCGEEQCRYPRGGAVVYADA